MSHLPKELKNMVDFLGVELGSAIQRSLGKSFYNHVESLRLASKSANSLKEYERLLHLVKRFSPEKRFYLAHSYSVLLELMNCAEAAYRSVQLRKKNSEVANFFKNKQEDSATIELVLTAHPTESRSKQMVQNSELMTSLLTRYFQDPSPGIKERVRSLIEKLWLESISKSEKPRVSDEADYIYELSLSPKVLRYVLSEDCPANIRLITWVGGDKDGHPLIDEKVMLDSMARSRKKLLKLIGEQLTQMLKKMQSPHVIVRPGEVRDDRLLNQIKKMLRLLSNLQDLKRGDSKRVAGFEKQIKEIIKSYRSSFASSYECFLIERLFEKFPSLVMPLELREDSGVVKEALSDKSLAIYKMLKTLDSLAEPQWIRNYVRGLVLSHTEAAEDLENGFYLLHKFKGLRSLPVVPLFESSAALVAGPQIIDEYLSKSKHFSLYRKVGRFEVMVGYSDSSKEFGALPSRKKIRDAIRKIELKIESKELKPVFFHGSGGSIARGGGSIEEQVSWWPKSCRELPKMTIQGEMVQRTFSRTEALSSFVENFKPQKLKKIRQDKKTDPVFTQFLDNIENEYRRFVDNEELLADALMATPYHYLDQLKLGSRPSKRGSGVINVSSLRAIPWVLCWTQTRILFPTWWGIGSAWANLSQGEKLHLKRFAKESPLLSSYLKLLGFSLAKIDFPIWKLYLSEFLDESAAANIQRTFQRELKGTKEALEFLTGESNPLWYKPWLAESIDMRSKYITPLNLLQILSMQDKDPRLLRECVTGIACGMMTTG